MLTSTYTLVTLSIEQASARIGLQSLLDRWHPNAWQHSASSTRQFELACDALRVAFDHCHWRKLDKFVVPALRRVDAAAPLLAELDTLTLGAIEARADAHAAAAVHDLDCFSAALERCCHLLLERLEREERELFSLARSHVPSEAWFAIANQMLANDTWQNENRSYPCGSIRAAARTQNTPRQTQPVATPHYATH